MLQQPVLPPQPAAVPAKLAVGVHDSVTGDDHGDAVHAVGASDCPLASRRIDAFGKLSV